MNELTTKDHSRIAYEFVAEFYDEISKTALHQARRATGGIVTAFTEQLQQDLIHVAIDRAPDIVRCYDCELSQLQTHMMNNLRLYMSKHMGAKDRRSAQRDANKFKSLEVTEHERQHDAQTGNEFEASETVYYLMQCLDQLERQVILHVAIGGITMETTADILSVSIGTVHNRFHAAIVKMREFADGRELF